MLSLIPIASAMSECQRVMRVSDIPCMILTSWNPGTCSNQSISILNQTNATIYVTSFGDYGGKCNATFNISTVGIYTWSSNIESGVVTVEAKDNMATLSIAIFVLLINIALFVIPSMPIVKFTENPIWDFLVKRCMYLLGLVILWFNCSIFMTFARDNGLGISSQLNTYFIMLSISLLAGFIWIIFTMLTTPMKIWKQIAERKTLGEDEGYES